MASRLKARIVGLGSYLPDKVLSNQDLEQMVDTTDEWIYTRTGIKERRIAGPMEFPSDMGTMAAKIALQNAQMTANEIDIILVATMTPDYISSSTAALIQHQIGAHRAAAFDVQAACTGYLYALSIAKAYVESGMYQHVLVIASEKMSAYIDYQDRNTCILFGDGASAAVVSNKGPGISIDTVCLGAAGAMAELINVPSGGSREPASIETVKDKRHFMRMQGKEVFKNAVRHMVAISRECLAKAELTEADISWLIPHQANERIIDAIAKSFEISLDKVFKTVQKYGNTSASSIAIALDELQQSHKLHKGEHLLLVGFGAGFTWGAAILTNHLEGADG